MARVLTESYWAADPDDWVDELTIGDALQAAAVAVPDRDALVFGVADRAGRRRWTYAELLHEVTRGASALAAHYPVGTCVAIWSSNRPEVEFVQLALALAGLPVVLLNPALKRSEAAYILRQSRCRTVFVDETQRGDLVGIAASFLIELPDLEEAISLGSWQSWVRSTTPANELPRVRPNDIAQVQYTSGTTGHPKGALLRHGGLMANSTLSNERLGVPDGGVSINPLPMFHVSASIPSVFGSIVRRGTHIIVPRFDPALVLELIESESGNLLVVVPTVLQALLAQPDLGTRDLSSMNTLLAGGSNLPVDMVERAMRAFDCNYTGCYGMTEAHGIVTLHAIEDPPWVKSTTAGRPLPCAEVKITDVVSGAVAPLGRQGEICVRGYQVMTGYLDQADETARVLDPQGWLHTGDLGRLDESGLLQVNGRLKDMIIRGGENIYPAEIENVLYAHPDVDEVQVVGVDDAQWGEQVCAVVRLVPESRAHLPALYAYCRERLAGFKCPRLWCLTDSFPTNASGKIQKFALRRLVAERALPIAWDADSTVRQP